MKNYNHSQIVFVGNIAYLLKALKITLLLFGTIAHENINSAYCQL